MVIQKGASQEIRPSSYDDLDAVNDFITICEDSKASPLVGQLVGQLASKCNDETNSNVKEEKSGEISGKRQSNQLESSIEKSSESSIKKEVECSKFKLIRHKIGGNIFKLHEQEVNSSVLSEPIFQMNRKISSNARIAAGQIEQVSVSQPISHEASKPVETCRYVVSKHNKIFECDFNRSKMRKFRKPIKPPNIYTVGSVEADAPNFNGQAFDTGNSTLNNHPISHFERPISSMLSALKMVKVQKMGEEEEKMPDALSTYFIGKTPSAIHISEADEYTDFIGRELFDNLQKKSSVGKMTDNYVKLTKNEFICYRSKRMATSAINGKDSVFYDPCSPTYCFLEKYRIDLANARLLLITGNSLFKTNWFCCYHPKISSSNIYDITDLDISTVMKSGNEYNVSIEKENSCELVPIKELDFVISKENQYYWFRSTNQNNFIKWLIAVQLRCREKAI